MTNSQGAAVFRLCSVSSVTVAMGPFPESLMSFRFHETLTRGDASTDRLSPCHMPHLGRRGLFRCYVRHVRSARFPVT